MIYFIQQSISGPIKIGWSAKQPLNRLDTMQTYHSCDLIGLGIMSGDRGIESKLHHQFKGIRLAREWFSPHISLLRFIRINARPFPVPSKRKPREKKRPNGKFSARLMSVRKKLSFSPEQLGAALGVSHQTIYRWEKGKSRPFNIVTRVIETKLDRLERQEAP